ncbi:MAG: YgjV family protein [Candidatus Nomurabacteria bacterium]|jgi:hypothetical protein|nr:YgjV family protein [Candidatus Nomurabacteria bacterium]
MDSFFTAQILGAVAALIFICSVQFKDKRHMVYFLVANTLVAGAALALLGAWGGFMTNMLTLLPALYIYYKSDKRHGKVRPGLMWLFLAIMFVGWLLIAPTVIDIFALVGSSVYICSLFQRKENSIRVLLLINQVMWLVYYSVVGQYPGLIFGVGFVVSDIIALHRFSKGHKKARRSVSHWWRTN